MGSVRNTNILHACKVCGTYFHPWAGRESTNMTCSRKCNGVNSKAANSHGPNDFETYVDKTDGCWTWVGPLNWAGYGVFCIGGTRHKAHRFAYERVHGEIPTGVFICHRCDNPRCVRVDHLWAGSHADNMADMRMKGRAHKSPSRHSESHPLAKLTQEKARKIRCDQRAAWRIADEYGVSKSLVWGIKRGTHWKYA